MNNLRTTNYCIEEYSYLYWCCILIYCYILYMFLQNKYLKKNNILYI